MVRVILEGKMGGGVFSLYPPLLYPSNLRENEGEKGDLITILTPLFAHFLFLKKLFELHFWHPFFIHQF